ncbi:MAG: autotransporter outer membrane beta-barrel domain-containing protein [Sphingomonadales bacterium]|nr:MAG: autotransporter outer membrane beta-barrel domain-containing protein [Sphingomonadales bacterium]
MTTNSNSPLRGFAKSALLVSAAFPLSALVAAAPAHAEEIVTVNAAETAASVNARIVTAKTTPDRDVTITIGSAGEVTTPGGLVTLTAAAGQADGKIGFSNAGKVGAVDAAGAVTDSVGVSLSGTAANADNTLEASNSGLITGGFTASGFGGTVSLDNSGTIYNGLSVSGKGDTSLISTGAVRSGSVVAASTSTVESTVAGDTTTSVFSSGDVTATVGDVASLDGTTKGSATLFAENGDVDASVTGTAGSVVAYSGGTRTSVNTLVAAPPADATTVISEVINSYEAGSVKLGAAVTSDVDAITGVANGDVALTVAGTVTNDVQAFLLGNSNTSNKTTVTLDALGGLLEQVQTGSSSAVVGDSTVDVAATADIGGNVNVQASRDAKITSAGAVGGSLSANGGAGSTFDNSTTVIEDGLSGLLGIVTSNKTASPLGDASIDLADGAVVGASVNATATRDASVINAGEVDGTLTARAGNGSASTFDQTQTFDGAGILLASTTKTTNGPSVGNASVVVAEAGSTGSTVLAVATNDASVENSGSIGGNVNVVAGNGNANETEQAYTYDATGALILTDEFKVTNTASEGNASVVVATAGDVDGAVSASATRDVSISNAGTIGSGVTGTSSGSDSSYTRTILTPEPVVDAGVTTTPYDYSEASTNTAATGKVDFTNAAGGIVGLNGVGNVSLIAGGDVTIVNQGDIRGSTFGQSSGNASSSDYALGRTTVADGLGGTTITDVTASNSANTQTGGNVTGTYAGANGTQNFSPAAIGNVTQIADLASTANVTGSVFGNLTSIAGNSGTAGSTSASSSTQTTVLDVDSTGSFAGDYKNSSASTGTVGGDSKVTVAGQVARSNAGGSASVFSQGANASTVVISGSVADDVTGNAFGARASTTQDARSVGQAITKAVYVTNTLSETTSNTSVITDGVSSVSITGKATANENSVGGSVSANGVASASADVASKAVVGGNLSVSSNNGGDSTDAAERTYVRDAATGVATAIESLTSTSGAAAAQGDAVAVVAGTVQGSTSVNAGRGDAAVTLTGVSQGSVNAVAGSSVTTSTTEREWTGKTKSASGDFGTLVASLTGRTFDESITSETVAVGGTASVLVDTAAALQDKAVPATSSVYAYGISGASVTVTKGSIVSGDVEAQSVGFNTLATSTTTDDGLGTIGLTASSTTTIVGGPATITNAGIIEDDARVTSATVASIANTGKIGDDVSANAVAFGTNTVSETTNFGKASLQTTTETFTPVVALGKASVTNAAGSVIGGDITVAGGEGTVTNNGTIGGTTVLGVNVDTASYTEVRTDTSTTTSYTPAAALLTQTYTVDQNGVSGGFTVLGGLDNDVSGEGAVRTSDVKATISLNSGSATLGSIIGERDADGNRTTDTTVNLVGAGFLGADAILYPDQKWPVGADKPTPLLSLGKDAQQEFGGANYQVRVLGVETLNKDGAGTFVINGAAYDPALPGGEPTYTLDVGNFNIKAGEVQLTTSQAADAEFGIRGNINNAATLLLGRRLTPGQNLFGNSIVGQTELIDGITVRQVGNFTQDAAGTTFVGITPSLVRVYRSEVSGGATLPEPLAPVPGGVSVGYFTTPAALGFDVDNSRVNITGDLDLSGRVAVNVLRDSLYANGDGYTLFAYTGTGAVSATAAPTLTSPFVGFTLVHDAAGKTVRLEVKRSSYTVGARNPNAQAAALGLDSALASSISHIRTDAAGGASFGSVTELGYAQDIANVAAAVDFRLSADQTSALFNELSSGEVYGSLASVDQNAVFGQALDLLTNRRSVGGDFATQLWLNPVGNWARFGDGDDFGASDIEANSYGLTGGLDFAYAKDGAFGFGAAYAEHDITARGTPEAVDGRTWTLGGYVTQGFGPLYANAKLAYGWTNYDATRTMTLLARTAEAAIDAKQLDVSLELGYDYRAGNVTVTPFGKLALRRTSLEGFTETEAGAFSLEVEGRKKTVFSPVLGVKVGTETALNDTVTLRPFARVSYTFQGDLPNDVTVRYVGGGDPFVLRGAEPDSFGSIEAGFEAKVAGRLNFHLSGSQTFGGDNKATGLRGGVSFQF